MIYFNIIVFKNFCISLLKKAGSLSDQINFGLLFLNIFSKQVLISCIFLDFNGKAYAYLLKMSILVKIYLYRLLIFEYWLISTKSVLWILFIWLTITFFSRIFELLVCLIHLKGHPLWNYFLIQEFFYF